MTDVLTPEQALNMLRELEPTKKERIAEWFQGIAENWCGIEETEFKSMMEHWNLRADFLSDAADFMKEFDIADEA